MPNWAIGNVTVRGKKENVRSFCKLFLFDSGHNDLYFARSFVHETWSEFEKEHFLNSSEGDIEINFGVDFAWSAYSCLIEGYPDENDHCITLEQACKDHLVEVEIETEEPGIGFEEKITYTQDLGLVNECNDMKTYKCKCGNEQFIPSSYDIGGETCYECDEVGHFTEV